MLLFGTFCIDSGAECVGLPTSGNLYRLCDTCLRLSMNYNLMNQSMSIISYTMNGYSIYSN